MAKLNMVEAINLALREEMEKDNQVIVLGEDVGREGGVFRVTDGLQDNLFTSQWDMGFPEKLSIIMMCVSCCWCCDIGEVCFT